MAGRVNVTPEQIRTLESKIAAFVASDTSQEGVKGKGIEITGDKEQKVRLFDRWLAT